MMHPATQLATSSNVHQSLDSNLLHLDSNYIPLP